MGRRRLEPNVFVVSEEEGLVYIHLSGKHGMGKISIVDLWSFKFYDLAAHIWRCTKDFYAYTIIDGKIVYLHRVVSGNDTKLHTDHIAGSEGEKSLDNRRCNLRICTNQSNQMNGKKRVDNRTNFKNVNQLKGMYRCLIRINKVKEYFGTYSKPEQAALAYNISIKEFADVYQLNDIPEGSLSEEEINHVHSVVEKRLKKINNKYAISVNPDFNKWTDKVKKEIHK